MDGRSNIFNMNVPSQSPMDPKTPPPPQPKPLQGDALRSVLQQAGFRGQGLDTAYGIAMAESKGNPMSHNDNIKTGDNSYGLFQINMLGKMGPARQQQYGLKSYNDLYNPLTNAKIAYTMSKGGTNFKPWSTYNSGAYQQYAGATPRQFNGAVKPASFSAPVSFRAPQIASSITPTQTVARVY